MEMVLSFSFFSDLDENTKIDELKTKIQELTKIAPPIEIRSGFPPKVLSAADEETLKSSGISSGGKNNIFAQSFQKFLELVFFFF